MISVIVPVYNTGHYLERVIQALLNQDYPQSEHELIFVDNGSTDDSASILKRYSRIRTFSEPDPGSYAARTRGIKQARGEILAFTDSDCFPVPGWLQSIDRVFSGSHAEVVLGPRVPPTNNNWVRLVSEYENRKAELVYASSDPMVYFGYTNNMAVRRTTMDRFGPFVCRARGSDTIFIRRVVEGLSCEAVTYCPEMIVKHAEMESIRVYYRKVMTYGRSRKAYHHMVKVRPLNQKERLRVFWQTTREMQIVDSIQLFTLLIGGAVAWWIGGLKDSTTDF